MLCERDPPGSSVEAQQETKKEAKISQGSMADLANWTRGSQCQWEMPALTPAASLDSVRGFPRKPSACCIVGVLCSQEKPHVRINKQRLWNSISYRTDTHWSTMPAVFPQELSIRGGPQCWTQPCLWAVKPGWTMCRSICSLTLVQRKIRKRKNKAKSKTSGGWGWGGGTAEWTFLVTRFFLLPFPLLVF